MKFISCDTVRTALVNGTPLKLEEDTFVVKSTQMTFPSRKMWSGSAMVGSAPTFLVNASLGEVRYVRKPADYLAILSSPGWLPVGIIRVVGFKVGDLKQSGSGLARLGKVGFLLSPGGGWFQAAEDHTSRDPSDGGYWLLLGVKCGYANSYDGTFKVESVALDGLASPEKVDGWCKRILKKASLR